MIGLGMGLRRSLVAVLVVVAAGACAGCEKAASEGDPDEPADDSPIVGTAKKRSGPYLVLMRDSQLVVVDVQAPGEQRQVDLSSKGTVTSALTVERGKRLLFVIDAAELWELTPGSAARQLWSGQRRVTLSGASSDGSVVGAEHGQVFEIAAGKATLVDLSPPAAAHVRTGAVSADGQRVLSSFVPRATCGEQPVKSQAQTSCPFEVWGIDRRVGKWQQIAASKLHSYNGLFMPGPTGDQIVFEVPQPDATCGSRPLWGCGVEDLYRSGFDGSGVELVRKATWVPRFSPDGKWMAASSPWGKQRALLVGPTAGKLAEIANDCEYVLHWSGDSEWISYQPRHGRNRVTRRDGSAAGDAGEGAPVGFLMQAPRRGAVVPPTPTRKDHLADALVAYQRHRTGTESLALLEVTDSDAIAAKVPTTALRFNRRQLVDYLKGSDRVMAIVSNTAVCDLDAAGIPTGAGYAVLSDPDKPYLLITNQLLDGERDRSPLAGIVRDASPRSTGTGVSAIFDDRIELVGVDLPAAVKRGTTFRVTLFYEVLRPLTRNWSTFVHFDGGGIRFQGDHEVYCGTRRWRPGQWIVDSFEVKAATVAGSYTLYTGFFTGGYGSWSRMKATGNMAITDDRVPVGKLVVE